MDLARATAIAGVTMSAMNVLAQIFAVLAGLLHVLIFVMESVLFRRPAVHGRFRTRPADLDAVRPWALNQGFYNLFLALGALGGVAAVHAGQAATGAAVALFSCACMLGAALVLIATDRRMARAALTQGLLPALALAAALLA
ncbi:membrane protein [Catellatospora sp. TT07R-123]|uniref:DUF1304 domain-containing protein n=1 Tax=Catellatospora sp. TT07R-123 TaxID=2733863 RepID=UPI001B0619AF|nr:DUF1304 domain-containing protein [Catellatospora sp. TT07R-123]GHJ44381.1 membrane protein [Catellatospora sp. TT07R-123]